MVTEPKIIQGEVWLATLDPTVGSEIKKTRPCLIVSPPEIHDYRRTVIVVPMTSGGFEAPYRIPVRFDGKSGLILPDQIRTLDRKRFIKRLGKIDPQTLTATLSVLRDLFAD
jgi:mRNA interferase MazF